MPKIENREIQQVYFPELVKPFRNFLKESKGKKVGVIGHARPDGDCIGSQVALTRALNSIGIEAIGVNSDAIPKNIRSLVADTPFEEKASNFDSDLEIFASVDCSSAERIGSDLRSQITQFQLCIDHHVSNEGFAAHNLIEPRASATCEILAGLFIDAGLQIDQTTAQALYVGIATDTGQFRYEATGARVFHIAAKLVEFGASPHEASIHLYEQDSFNRIQLLQQFLSTLKSELEGRLVIGRVNTSMYDETGTTKEHTEGFVDYARNLEAVEIAALLEEQTDGSVKGSLRSKYPKYRVDQLASVFSGGGHACAAGFHWDGSIGEFYQILVDKTEEHLKNLGS